MKVNEALPSDYLTAEPVDSEARFASLTTGFTKAAVLNGAGQVIGEVLAPSAARSVTLVDAVYGLTLDNARERKISRSKSNLARAFMSPWLFTCALRDGRIVYCCIE